MKKYKRIFFYVGFPKTGSYYIRTIIDDYRNELLDQGFLYPGTRPGNLFTGKIDQTPLVEEIMKNPGVLGDFPSSRPVVALLDELDFNRGRCHTAMIASESFIDFVDSPRFEFLVQQARSYAEEVEAIVVLRRYPERFESAFNQWIKYPWLPPLDIRLSDYALQEYFVKHLKEFHPQSWNLPYKYYIDKLDSLFGISRVHIHAKAPRTTADENLIDVFNRITGMDLPSDETIFRNLSINAKLVDLLYKVLTFLQNTYGDVDAFYPRYQRFCTTLAPHFLHEFRRADETPLMPHDVAREIMDRFASDDRALALSRFGREELFSGDLSAFSEEGNSNRSDELLFLKVIQQMNDTMYQS